MPLYTLTVEKSGAKLKKFEAECTPGPDGHCGGYVSRIGRITGQKTSMAQLADTLSAIMDRPVIDKTSRVGLYNDVELEWVPDEMMKPSTTPGALTINSLAQSLLHAQARSTGINWRWASSMRRR